MPLWNTPQAGSNTVYPGLNFTSLSPGDDLELLNANDVVATGTKSIAFARSGGLGGQPGKSTFSVTGCPNGSVIEIEGSNGVAQSSTKALTVTPTPANMDASFNVVGTVTGNGPYLDEGAYAFYRVVVSTFEAGDVPVVIIKR